MQSELSLDSVKVVHNDLSDADVEVVPIKSRTADEPAVPDLPPPKKSWEFLGERLFARDRGLTNGKPCAVPDFVHKTVMAAEVLDALKPRPGGRYADGTLGGAGHAASILAASSPTGWLFGCDRDGAAVEAAKKRLAEKFAGRFEIRRGNFAEMAGWIPAASCDGVLLDLGVSSPQLDSPERGFSFQQDGPLDMRMDDAADADGGGFGERRGRGRTGEDFLGIWRRTRVAAVCEGDCA